MLNTQMKMIAVRALSIVFLVIASLGFTTLAVAQNVTTEQYGNARTGVQNQETVLTPSNVNSASFGKLFSLPVTGHVYAQPLYMAGLTMNDGKIHNVLFVATERDYLYAFDADGNNPAQGYLWRDFLVGTGETSASYSDVNNSDIYPDIGITSTPVIDPSTGTIYVVAKSKTTATPAQFFQRIHAINLADGSEKFHGPTVIQATVPGTAGGGATISFDPLLGNQRPGLLLAPTPKGSNPTSVFIAWASHGDNGSYHGWVMSYDAADVSQQTGVWANTPNGIRGGIWQTGGGLSSDGNGNIFAGCGNGTFDVNTGGVDYGNSAVALTMNGTTLSLTSYYTPTDQNGLADNDMGTSSVMLLPPQSGPIPHLAVVAEKIGHLFLLNSDSLGGYLGSIDTSLQTFSIGHSILTSPAFFNNTLYLAGEGGPLSAWTFDPVAQRFSTTPASKSSATFGCDDCGGAGTTPVISANGTANAIVWVLDNSGRENSPAILRAYDPLNLQNVFYSSDQAANHRDAAAIAVKFTMPVVVNGHVYVGGVNAVTVYGELGMSPSISITATPGTIAPGASSSLSVSAANLATIKVTGSDGSSFTLPSSGGTQTVTPSATTTYTATGTTTSGTNVVATATVTVTTGGGGCLPSSPGVSICAPANNATTGSSVTITAGALSPSGNMSAMRAYIDNVSVFTVSNPSATNSMQVTQIVNVAQGSHQLYVVGYPSTGGYVSSSSKFTVSTSGGCLPSSPGLTICAPANNANTGSSVTITAGALSPSGNMSAIRAYIDNVSVFTVNNPSATNSMQVTQTVSVAPGPHQLYVVGYPSTGGYVSSSENFTASGTTNCVPTAQGATICSPANHADVNSPVTISAGATTSSGYISAIRVYVDNIVQATVNNPQATTSFSINQAFTMSQGSHYVVVVGYQSTGGALTANETITVEGQ
jgi:hypothetical protein